MINTLGTASLLKFDQMCIDLEVVLNPFLKALRILIPDICGILLGKLKVKPNSLEFIIRFTD